MHAHYMCPYALLDKQNYSMLLSNKELYVHIRSIYGQNCKQMYKSIHDAWCMMHDAWCIMHDYPQHAWCMWMWIILSHVWGIVVHWVNRLWPKVILFGKVNEPSLFTVLHAVLLLVLIESVHLHHEDELVELRK